MRRSGDCWRRRRSSVIDHAQVDNVAFAVENGLYHGSVTEAGASAYAIRSHRDPMKVAQYEVLGWRSERVTRPGRDDAHFFLRHFPSTSYWATFIASLTGRLRIRNLQHAIL